MDPARDLQVASAQPVLSWLIPYDQRLITVPLDQATVEARLEACFVRLDAGIRTGRLIPRAGYKGALSKGGFVLRGPIHRRRTELVTTGQLYSDSYGSQIELTLRMSTMQLLNNLVLTIFGSCFLLIINQPPLLSALAFVIVYLVFIIMAAKYEGAWIVRLLREGLATPLDLASGAQQVTVLPRRFGWACSACGSYVRQDARFCSYCERPFNT